jgi:hypothetical protein
MVMVTVMAKDTVLTVLMDHTARTGHMGKSLVKRKIN